MSTGFGQDDGFFQSGQYDQASQQSGYAMPTYDNSNLGGGGFGSFDYSQQGAMNAQQSSPAYAPIDNSTMNYSLQQSTYTGTIMTPDPHAFAQTSAPGEEDYENEPPLLEELGINFNHIYQKTLAVLNPLKQAEQEVVADSDLAGPLVFCLSFGATLLLAGKVSFGYVYGLGVVGSVGMYTLLNLMSLTGVAATCVISVLGYCLLPMVLLSAAAVLTTLQGIVGIVLTCLAVMWCSFSASKLFVAALQMDQQQLLIAYPCALVYAVFALLTVF